MKKISFFILTSLLLIYSSRLYVFASSHDLSKNDILLIEQALESSAQGDEFSALVSLASVLINRYSSPLYPRSMLKIIEGDPNLTLDLSVEPSQRSRLAVRYALLGSSPLSGATGMARLDLGRPAAAEYIIIGGWFFYTE